MQEFNIGDYVRPNYLKDWVKITDVDKLTMPTIRYKLNLNGYEWWDVCFGWEKKSDEEDILRYGEYLTDDQLTNIKSYSNKTVPVDFVRIRIIKYENKIYYHKMVNGEVIEFKELIV